MEKELVALALSIQGKPMCVAQCVDVWRRLTNGSLRVSSSFVINNRSYLIAGCAASKRAALSARNREILELALLGRCRKRIAYELGIGESTMAQALKQTLLRIGVVCSPAKVPLLLSTLVHAARKKELTGRVLMQRAEHDGRAFLVLIQELEVPLLRRLTPAERAVLRLRIQGESYSNIAAARRTSYRTVANQIASACHRLGVSGRLDLLRAIAAPADAFSNS